MFKKWEISHEKSKFLGSLKKSKIGISGPLFSESHCPFSICHVLPSLLQFPPLTKVFHHLHHSFMDLPALEASESSTPA